VSEEVNRKLPAKNTAVQVSTLYTDPSTTMHDITDRLTDRRHYDTNSRWSYCITVQSGKMSNDYIVMSEQW